MEGRIIQVVDFSLLKTTSLDYFNLAHRLTRFSEKDYFLGRYMLEISLFDISMYKYHPRVIAFSIMFFINKLRKNDCWNDNIARILDIN